MSTTIQRGTKQVVDGRLRIYYDGYWIKTYDVPADTLRAKKHLIEALTRRLFNHVEHGLNVPGEQLDAARATYAAETCPRRKRVKAGMLAGALFNRAADVFTKLVELQALGVKVTSNDPLMRLCGEHLQEALKLGKLVLHRSGEEGIDELWGEPFKAFAYPIEDFYTSRYVKIAMAMTAIDQITHALATYVGQLPMFSGIGALAMRYGDAARAKCETLRTDPEIFEIWTSFAVSGELLGDFQPRLYADATSAEQSCSTEGMNRAREARQIIEDITRARVPMPKTTRAFIQRCIDFRESAAPVVEAAQVVA